ncbi:MAG: ArsR/SmtB family transcription factor [Steroidobacteraceae bacterium]
MKSNQAIHALGALAQESRLAVFRLLVKRGPDGFTPGEILERLDIPAPTLSFHLKELQRARLLIAHREGRFLYYSADFGAMRELLAYLTENCCGLSATDCDDNCMPVKSSARKRKTA